MSTPIDPKIWSNFATESTVLIRSLTAEQWTVCVGEGGADCCAYAAVNAHGFCCLKGSALGETILARLANRQMNAMWIPTAEHPCRNPAGH